MEHKRCLKNYQTSSALAEHARPKHADINFTLVTRIPRNDINKICNRMKYKYLIKKEDEAFQQRFNFKSFINL